MEPRHSPRISVSVRLERDCNAPGSLGASTSPLFEGSMAQGLEKKEETEIHVNFLEIKKYIAVQFL